MSDKAMVLRNQFVNQKTPSKSHSGSVRRFIMDYMLRSDAVEPVIVDENRQRTLLNQLSQLKAPRDSQAISYLNNQLKYDGVGFSLDSLAMSRKEMLEVARDAQHAYDRGATVKQTVISFDTKWLKDKGILDPSVELPVKRGDLRGKLDSVRLRRAIIDGVNAMVDQTTMHHPQMAAAIQTDTAHVHVHLCLWDQDERVKDDRGKLNSTQIRACLDGIESSVATSLPSLNTTRDMQNLAKLTQKNAQFKLQTLEQQLYNSALRLDQQSLNEYIRSLAQFDGRTLSVKQRQNLSKKIREDYMRQGRPTRRSHTLSRGQRRARRQIWAQRRANNLRRERQYYNQQAASGHVSTSAQVVKDALDFEFQRNEMIVEKYRTYARPLTASIYQRHAESLKNRYEVLNARRAKLLKSMGGYYLRPTYLNRLLKNRDVMQGFAEDSPTGSVSDSPAYKQIKQAVDDGYTPLSEHTIHVVIKHMDRDDGEQVSEILRQNQKTPNNDQLSARSRRELYQYLEDLDEYEADAASWGGLNTDTNNWNVNFKLGDNLPAPDQTASVYRRDMELNTTMTDDLAAVDVHHILDAGELKPEVARSMRKQMLRRQRLLTRVDDYFRQTHQERPDWLKDSMRDLINQYKVYRQSTGQEINLSSNRTETVEKPNNPVEVNGYELNESTRRELVQKHLKDVDALSL